MPTQPRIPGIEVRPNDTAKVRINRRGVRANHTFTDLGAAISWRTRALHAIDRGQPLPALPGAAAATVQTPKRSATILDASDHLLSGIERGEIRTKTGAVYKPATARKYESALRLDVLPELGGVKVVALETGDVQRWVDQTAAQRGVEQAVNALTALRVVLHACMRYGELERDPCVGVRVPRSTTTPRAVPVLSAAAARTLIAAAERDDAGNHLRPAGSFIAPMVRLGLDTGLRMGELLGLRWGAEGVDLDAGLIHVTQAVDRKLDPDTLAYPVIDPKSRSSRRVLPISPDTTQAMREHRLATGRPRDGALVWAQPDGRPMAASGKPRSCWRRVRKAAGLADLRFHDLRHIFATHQLASGTGIHAAADLLGHADAGQVLRRYGHSMPEEIASSAERLAAWRAAQ